MDIRGRSRTLRVNYRTSHQIRTQADRLLGPAVTDVDGNSENRNDTVSVFNGPPPTVRSLGDESVEIKTVGGWIADAIRLSPHHHRRCAVARAMPKRQRISFHGVPSARAQTSLARRALGLRW